MSQVINIYFDSYDSNKAEEFTIDEGRFSRLQIEIFARTLFFLIFLMENIAHMKSLVNDVNML